MYAILAKRDNDSWEIIHLLDYATSSEKKAIIDNALDSSLSITSMETTSYKNAARINSVWNGESFSGGNELSKDADDSEEFWGTVKKYSFLCDNKIILNIIVKDNTDRSEVFATAFADEVKIVAVPENQHVFINETYGWNGTEFTQV